MDKEDSFYSLNEGPAKYQFLPFSTEENFFIDLSFSQKTVSGREHKTLHLHITFQRPR